MRWTVILEMREGAFAQNSFRWSKSWIFKWYLNIIKSCSTFFISVRVYTFPCIRVFLDSTEVCLPWVFLLLCSDPCQLVCLLVSSLPSFQLFKPEDDNLEQYWIDFNLGSSCVSFFINDPEVRNWTHTLLVLVGLLFWLVNFCGLPQASLWESVHLTREIVYRYCIRGKMEELVCSETRKTEAPMLGGGGGGLDRKSTRWNSRGGNLKKKCVFFNFFYFPFCGVAQQKKFWQRLFILRGCNYSGV